MWEVSDKDPKGNVIDGNMIIKNVSNLYLRSEK